ncbi:NAD(P)/FAD-dependent oxidoreductase [Rhodococcus xishaensis]|uniref:NAD(P)/FAD-dependent oxidoreductase n=1 Tax=Rhodococcus xishaensis TaxID=2487364 RepID=A0A3S3A865_9NOCA|nr:FAD-dependent oxidoreductase [Rhodococcus xishaensis]RVW04269.1 NAD(P)/FAD-dependent oxidoreductase [Rhodococcus xishaensis]
MRILVLGAGFGGLELTTRLSEELGEKAETVLIDKTEGFVFGFSKLDVMFGRATPESVFHPYRDCVKPGVEFVQATVASIDPVRRRVETDAGPYEGDVLVVALGADLDPAATPGLAEGGHEFYTEAGAFAAGEVLAEFAGGRVIVGLTSTPFKCPPAPSEAALFLHDFLTERGLREESDISLVMPLPAPIPPSPDASRALLSAFEERGISFHPNDFVRELDPGRKVARLAGGGELAYDLFLGVPVHRAPPVVEEAGMCVDGWVPVDPYTLQTRFSDVFALGDVTSVGTAKAGVFSEGQAAVVAQALIARHRGGESPLYGGKAVCYIEFGRQQVATVDVTFRPDQTPYGTMAGPSAALAADKAEFGTTRIRRWFGSD